MNIKEAAARTGLSTDTLRYYEKEGLIPAVRRDESGYRDYDEHTLRWIELIQHFRGTGVSIGRFAEYVRLAFSDSDTKEARRAILVEVRDDIKARITRLQSCLDVTERKLAKYDDLCDPVTIEIVTEWKEALGQTPSSKDKSGADERSPKDV
ncbi:MAG: MerR family transcriptional regulator [Pyramidobacter sp.]|nr:MerR family transcriptional regulator [Pyramidobacter sp.]